MPKPTRSTTRSLSEGSGIKKGFDCNPAPGIPQQRQDATPVGRIQSNHGIGPSDRPPRSFPACRPFPKGPSWCVGSLGHYVRNTETIGNRRAKPIRSLVIEVIGKPKFRRCLGRFAAAAEEILGERRAEQGQSLLTHRIATPFVAPKPGGYKSVVPGKLQSREKQLRDPAVSGRDRMIRRLQGRIKGDAHSIQALSRPPLGVA